MPFLFKIRFRSTVPDRECRKRKTAVDQRDCLPVVDGSGKVLNIVNRYFDQMAQKHRLGVTLVGALPVQK